MTIFVLFINCITSPNKIIIIDSLLNSTTIKHDWAYLRPLERLYALYPDSYFYYLRCTFNIIYECGETYYLP